MTVLSFQLTMPNVGSWNGKWTGEGRPYFITRSIPKKTWDSEPQYERLRKEGRDSFYYRWDDGWGASVIVEVVDGKEAAKRRKLSAGFCGYDWMVDSIIKRGKITTD